jgi:hypothetical protein
MDLLIYRSIDQSIYRSTSEDRMRLLIVVTAYSEIEFYYYLVVHAHTVYIHVNSCT